MVGRCNHNHIARQLIKLHQKERDYPLYLSGLMSIAPFLAD